MRVTIDTVRNDAEHDLALHRIKALWESRSEDDLAEMDVLTLLVDAYERKRWPVGDELDPVDMIKGAMEYAGRTRAELVALLGSSSRTDEVLARHRPLTLEMIRTISDAWGIPIMLLTPVYALEAKSLPA